MPKSVPGPLRGHIGEFDGLRGLAILAVMVHHFWPGVGHLAPWSHVPHLGWIGVDLFFVISGCLITGILLDTRHQVGFLRKFYSRRIIRIFPLYYLFVAAAFVVIPRLQGTGEFLERSGSCWWYIAYLGNVRESLRGAEPAYVLAVTWSLCIEEQFYVLFPLVVRLLSPAKLWKTLWALVLVAPLFRLVTALVWPANERVQYLATPSRVDVLALGCLIALGFRGHGRLPSPSLVRILFPLSVLGCGVAFMAGGLDRTTFFGRVLGYSVVDVTMFLFVLWVAQRRGAKAVAWLRLPPLRGLGTLCYGLYLLQRPAQVLAGKAMAWAFPGFDVAGSGWGLLVFPASALVAALLSWYLLERPMLRFKAMFASSTHPSSTPAADPLVAAG